MRNILIIGAGRSSSSLIKYLLDKSTSENLKITVGDISVAAAIILQNVTTKLRNSNLDWKLSIKEKEELYFDWVQKTIKNVNKIKEYYYQNNM